MLYRDNQGNITDLPELLMQQIPGISLRTTRISAKKGKWVQD